MWYCFKLYYKCMQKNEMFRGKEKKWNAKRKLIIKNKKNINISISFRFYYFFSASKIQFKFKYCSYTKYVYIKSIIWMIKRLKQSYFFIISKLSDIDRARPLIHPTNHPYSHSSVQPSTFIEHQINREI